MKGKKANNSVDVATVMHVARLARLNITEKEAKKYQKELGEILASFKVLKSAKPAKPSFHPLDVKDVMRKDEPEPGLKREDALRNTKHRENGYFKGPRAV